MTQLQNRPTADPAAGVEMLRAPEELDLLTADGLAGQGCAAIARRARLLLLDLTGLSFCDARGLGALVQIANHADAAGCRYGLIAPQPQVAKILRIGGLHRRMPVFATIDDALAHLTAALPGPLVPKPSAYKETPCHSLRVPTPIRYWARSGRSSSSSCG